MGEFRHRMKIQREILDLVNQVPHLAEQLCGLSAAAINRWCAENSISPHDKVPYILREVSTKLCFLATKSQDQISRESEAMSSDIKSLIGDLRILLQR